MDQNKLWNIIKEMGIKHHLSALPRNLYAGQEAKLEMDMEQQTGSKLGKELAKAKEPAIILPTSVGSYKKQRNYRKTSTSASLTTLKPLTVWITTNCGTFLNRWEYQTTLPAS